jgi:aspartyl-tRNA(Asn)/glutamyl-tRNA(Gln) amidotransferase subunit C
VNTEKLNEAQITHLALLARLEVDERQRVELLRELGAILGYMEKLSALDTSGVEPTSHVLDLINAFRADEVQPSLTPGEALQNAPGRQDDLVVVPRIIEE